MATAHIEKPPNVVRFSLTGAISAGAFFVFCWIGALLPIGPATHMYLRLFTNADITSGQALLQGTLWSVGFGLITGVLLSVVYRATAFLDRG